jgi:hypothetical protein
VYHLAPADCRPRWAHAFRGLLAAATLFWLLPGILPARQPPGSPLPAAARTPEDSFPHRRHTKVACLTCHLSRTGEKLTFEAPRGCQICHHQVRAREGCTQCHVPSRLDDTLVAGLTVTVANHPARERPVAFPHRRHAEQPCRTCHAVSLTMDPVDSALACTGCHEEHHDADRTCTNCHRIESLRPAHARPVRAHVACDRCHPTATVARLSPTRSFCLTCHARALDHQPDRECVTCHLQVEPDQYRARLLKPRPAG